MTKKLLSTVLSICVLASSMHTTYALTEKQSRDRALISGAVAVAAGLVGGSVVGHKVGTKGWATFGCAVGTAAIGGAITAHLLYQYLLKTSPEVSLQKSQEMFEKVTQNEMVTTQIYSKEDFCNFVVADGSSYMKTESLLNSADTRLKCALKLAIFSCRKTENKIEKVDINSESKVLISKIESLIPNIDKKRRFIADYVAFERARDMYNAIVAQLNRILLQRLVEWAIDSPQTVINNSGLYHGGAWPLVHVLKDLKDTQNRLKFFVGQLTTLMHDNAAIETCCDVVRNSEVLLGQIREVLNSVEVAIGYVAVSSAYITQVRMVKQQRQFEQQQRIDRERIAQEEQQLRVDRERNRIERHRLQEQQANIEKSEVEKEVKKKTTSQQTQSTSTSSEKKDCFVGYMYNQTGKQDPVIQEPKVEYIIDTIPTPLPEPSAPNLNEEDESAIVPPHWNDPFEQYDEFGNIQYPSLPDVAPAAQLDYTEPLISVE